MREIYKDQGGNEWELELLIKILQYVSYGKKLFFTGSCSNLENHLSMGPSNIQSSK